MSVSVRGLHACLAAVLAELGQVVALLDELDPDHDEAGRDHHPENDDDDLQIGDHGPYRI